MSEHQRLNRHIFLAAVLGVSAGIGLAGFGAETALGSDVLYVAKLLSTFFLDLLRMVVVPLVFTSLVCGVAGLGEHRQMRGVWRGTILFFVASMAVAFVIGLTASDLFEPGAGLQLGLFADATRDYQAQHLAFSEYFAAFLHGLFKNPFDALARGDILAVVTFAIFLGVALAVGGERYGRLRGGVEELQTLMLTLVGWIMRLAPLGVGALLLQLAATQDSRLLESLLEFILVVIGATLVHGVLVLPMVLYLITGVSPVRFWRGARDALVMAFATSSSAATLPVTLRCLRDGLGVRRAVAGFVAPLGATLNMDGTALYEGAAVLFIARLAGVELDLGQQMVVMFVAMIGAIGAPGIPSVGMLSMVLVLQSVGLPTEAVALLIPIDRILDTVRTAVNVEGDMVGSLVVERLALGGREETDGPAESA